MILPEGSTTDIQIHDENLVSGVRGCGVDDTHDRNSELATCPMRTKMPGSNAQPLLELDCLTRKKRLAGHMLRVPSFTPTIDQALYSVFTCHKKHDGLDDPGMSFGALSRPSWHFPPSGRGE
jgi:hypothetical protein